MSIVIHKRSASQPAVAVVLLFLVHLLYGYGEWLYRIGAKVWRNLRQQINYRVDNRHNHKFESAIKRLDKIPTHLLVMLGSETERGGAMEHELDYKQLVQFVFWCLMAGIGHVSFYDHRGILKRNHLQMLTYVTSRKHSDSESEQIVWTPQLGKSSSGGLLLPPRNGYRRRLVVNFFSPEDGKPQLVAVAKRLASAGNDSKANQPAHINERLVSERLQVDRFTLPDPELAVYFGAVCSTYGALPWQVRLTEFMSLEVTRLSELGVEHFLRCLRRYAKCEQRFGK